MDLQQQLNKQGTRKGLFRAELYLPDFKDGKRAGIADVIRASFSGTEVDLSHLRLAMLDVIMLDGKDLLLTGGAERENRTQLFSWD